MELVLCFSLNSWNSFFGQLYNNGSWHIFLLFNQSLIHISCGQHTYKFENGIFHFLLPTCFEFLRMFLIYFRFENCIEDFHRAFWWIVIFGFRNIEKWRIISCSHSMPLIRCVYLFSPFLIYWCLCSHSVFIALTPNTHTHTIKTSEMTLKSAPRMKENPFVFCIDRV